VVSFSAIGGPSYATVRTMASLSLFCGTSHCWQHCVTASKPPTTSGPTIPLCTTNRVSVLHVFLSVCACHVSVTRPVLFFVCVHICCLSMSCHFPKSSPVTARPARLRLRQGHGYGHTIKPNFESGALRIEKIATCLSDGRSRSRREPLARCWQ
jgi:hypothetical protein